MSGMGKQAVKLKAVSPKTAPVLSEKLTFTDNKKWWQQGKKKVVARRVRVLGLNVRRKLFFVMVEWITLAIRRSRRMLVNAVMYATGATTCPASLSHLRSWMLSASSKCNLFWVCSYCEIVTPPLFQKAGSGLIE